MTALGGRPRPELWRTVRPSTFELARTRIDIVSKSATAGSALYDFGKEEAVEIETNASAGDYVEDAKQEKLVSGR